MRMLGGRGVVQSKFCPVIVSSALVLAQGVKGINSRAMFAQTGITYLGIDDIPILAKLVNV